MVPIGAGVAVIARVGVVGHVLATQSCIATVIGTRVVVVAVKRSAGFACARLAVIVFRAFVIIRAGVGVVDLVDAPRCRVATIVGACLPVIARNGAVWNTRSCCAMISLGARIRVRACVGVVVFIDASRRGVATVIGACPPVVAIELGTALATSRRTSVVRGAGISIFAGVGIVGDTATGVRSTANYITRVGGAVVCIIAKSVVGGVDAIVNIGVTNIHSAFETVVAGLRCAGGAHIGTGGETHLLTVTKDTIVAVRVVEALVADIVTVRYR